LRALLVQLSEHDCHRDKKRDSHRRNRQFGDYFHRALLFEYRQSRSIPSSARDYARDRRARPWDGPELF
jgi:hypothetical protein